VQALSGLIRRPGGFTKSVVAWVRLTVPVGGRGSRRMEYPPTLVRGCPRDEHSPMSRVFLTHSAAQAVHALRSGRPSAQGGWVKGSCLVREGVPTDRRHAALKQRTTHRLRGTEDER
jgi:hypothetical protein